jgi:hypothetical protein
MTTSREVTDLLAAVAREPTNLAVRVKAGNALIQIGELAQALEMFRGVVRDHAQSGRHAQARIVAKSVLQHAPNDAVLLAAIEGPPSGTTRPPPRAGSDADRTPLPAPMPYHDADPSKISMSFALLDASLDTADESSTSRDIEIDFDVDEPSLVGTDPVLRPRTVIHSGLSAAARAISQRLQSGLRHSDTDVRTSLGEDAATHRIPLQDPDEEADVTHQQSLLTPPPD